MKFNLSTNEIAYELERSTAYFTYYKRDRMNRRKYKIRAKFFENTHYIWNKGRCLWDLEQVKSVLGGMS